MAIMDPIRMKQAYHLYLKQIYKDRILLEQEECQSSVFTTRLVMTRLFILLK